MVFLNIVLLFYILSSVQSIDLTVKGDTCSSLDLCEFGDKYRSEVFRTCDCDDDCYKYGTCCMDADSFPLMNQTHQEFQCNDDRTVTPVFVKRTCSDDFKGHVAHRTSCMESEADRADIMGNILVTSSRTKISYWNTDCAICNNEDEADLTKWTIQVSCPNNHGVTRINQKYIKEHLTFDRDENKWGLKIDDQFVPCSIVFFQPSEAIGRLRYCAPNLTATCPSTYTDTGTIKRCLTYHGERKVANRYHKNVHCALCNGVSLKQMDCVGRNYPPLRIQSGRDIVKVIFPDGEWLVRKGGSKFKCGNHFSYNPFWKKCLRTQLSPEEDKLTATSAQNSAAQWLSVLAVLVYTSNQFRFA